MIAGWQRSEAFKMELYILLAGVEIGPLTERQVRAYLHDGLISETDLSRRNGLGDWESVTELLAHLSAEAPASVTSPTPVSPAEPSSALDVLADSEPAYPLLSSSAAPDTIFPETSPLPKSSPAPRTRTRRKPSKLVIQPRTPLPDPAPVAKSEPEEPVAITSPYSVESLPTSDSPPYPDIGREETVPANSSADPADFQQPEPFSEHTPSESHPVVSPLPALHARRKKKTFRQKHSVLIYALPALGLLIALPVCAWLFSGSKQTPFAAPSPDLSAPGAATKNEEDLILASNPQTADAFAKRGMVRKKRGMVDAALDDFNQAVRLDPKYLAAYYGRGQARLNKGDWEAAISNFDQVLDLDPRYANAFNDRAYARQNLGDLDGALTDYDQALAIDPKIAVAYYNRGMIELQRGKPGSAVLDFNHTLDLNPEMAYAYFNRGNAKNADGNLDGAIADYTQALILDSKIASAYSNRGFARQSKGDLNGAIADYTQALAINPNLPVAFYNRALARLALGDLDGAIADSTKAIELNPRDATSYCNRGLALLGKGQLDQAAQDLHTFCQQAPQDPDADAARLYLWLIATEQNPRGNADDTLADALLNNWNSPSDSLTTTIARFLLNRVGESDLFAATDSSDPIQSEVQQGKALYFAGMKHLFMGDQATAVTDFRKVLQCDKKDFCEYLFAQEQLRALGESLTPPATPSR